MQTQQPQPSGLRAASISLTLSIIGLWILIPLIVVLAVLMLFASVLFNDSGHVPQAVAPFVGSVLGLVVGLVVLLIFSMRTRRHLAQRLPRARNAMLVIGTIYTLIALGVLFFPFPDPLAIFPGIFGIWWLIYFLKGSTREAFENHQPAPEIIPPTS